MTRHVESIGRTNAIHALAELAAHEQQLLPGWRPCTPQQARRPAHCCHSSPGMRLSNQRLPCTTSSCDSGSDELGGNASASPNSTSPRTALVRIASLPIHSAASGIQPMFHLKPNPARGYSTGCDPAPPGRPFRGRGGLEALNSSGHRRRIVHGSQEIGPPAPVWHPFAGGRLATRASRPRHRRAGRRRRSGRRTARWRPGS